MDSVEKYNIWQIDIIRDINDHMKLVKNKLTGRIMLYQILPVSTLQVMQALSKIEHPNVMEVYDAYESSVSPALLGRAPRFAGETVKVCLALCEYIEGSTLEQYVSQSGPFDVAEAKRIIFSVCDGLSELHSHSIIHRDINPSNVMMTNGGKVKIIDFDITREFKSNKNQDTQILGTVGYASPEQFGFAQTDALTDIYSIGVLLNYLLTGALPNEKKASGHLGLVISKCIEIDKAKRYQDIASLKRAIEEKKFFKRLFPLPGFREGGGLKVFVIIYLIATFLIFFSQIRYKFYFVEFKMYNFFDIVAEIVKYLFCYVFSYLLIGNVAYLSDLICPNNPRRGRTLTIVLGIASFIIGRIAYSLLCQAGINSLIY